MLNRAKLGALARAAGAPRGPDAEPIEFGTGAAMLAGRAAWVLVTEADVADIASGRGLGAAIIWAHRAGATELTVFTEGGVGVMARRAGEFDLPIRVVAAPGADVSDVVPAEPSPVLAPDPAHLDLVETIAAAGAEPIVEHGVVIGEVCGLEVCRVVAGTDGAARLEVGIGAHDREAFAMIHGDVPPADALAGVVDTVAAVRGPGRPPHPLQRLAPERLMRWRLGHDPSGVGMVAVWPTDPPVPRRNLSDRSPCTAVGERADGSTAVIVCSVGVDLDVIPYAADARLARGEPSVGSGGTDSAELIVVTPSRDAVAATRELADRLRHSLTLSTFD